MTDKKLVLTLDQTNSLVSYLASKPFAEVAQLIQLLQNNIKTMPIDLTVHHAVASSVPIAHDPVPVISKP